MKRLDALRNAAVETLQSQRADGRAQLHDRFGHLSFPAALAILPVGQSPPTGPDGELLKLPVRPGRWSRRGPAWGKRSSGCS